MIAVRFIFPDGDRSHWWIIDRWVDAKEPRPRGLGEMRSEILREVRAGNPDTDVDIEIVGGDTLDLPPDTWVI